MEIKSTASLTREEIELAIEDWMRQKGFVIEKRIEFVMSANDDGLCELHGANFNVQEV